MTHACASFAIIGVGPDDEDGQGLAEYALILPHRRSSRSGGRSIRRGVVGRSLSSGDAPSRTAASASAWPMSLDSRTLHATLRHARVLAVSYQRVLALWYSRAALGRCYSGATCHTSRGDINLKRSNRLVLLVGVFLAIVAFVGILLLCRAAAVMATAARRADHGAADRRRGRATSRWASRIQADQVDDRGHGHRRPSLPGAFDDTSQVIGKIVRTAGHRRPADHGRDLRGQRLDPRHRLPGHLASAWPSRSTRSPASARSSRPATTWTWSWASPATQFPVITLNPTDDSFTVVSGLNSTSVKALLQGMQVVGHAAPAAARRRTPNGQPPEGEPARP